MYPLCFMKKDTKHDSLLVIDNYNFYDRQTYKQAVMGTLWPTRPDVNEVYEHILNHESVRKYQRIEYFPNQTGKDGLGLNWVEQVRTKRIASLGLNVW